MSETSASLYAIFNEFLDDTAYASREWKAIGNNLLKYIRDKSLDEPGLVTDYIEQSRGDKTQAKQILLDFFKYYEKRTGKPVVHALSKVNPIDIPALRRLEILKYLHKPHTTKEISEYFGIGDDSVRDDLAALRNGYEIFGMTIKVEERVSGRQQVKTYRSTVHPVFLALNASEVYALTVLLERYAEENNTMSVFSPIIDKIYAQLSEYGKNTIIGKQAPDFADKRNSVNEAFSQEEKWLNEDHNNERKLVFLMKSGTDFNMEAMYDSQIHVFRQCRVFDLDGDGSYKIKYTTNGKEASRAFKISDIVSIEIENYPA